jgi:hypothetical protein
MAAAMGDDRKSMMWQRLIHRFGYHKVHLVVPETNGILSPGLLCYWCGLYSVVPEKLWDQYFGKEH